MKVLFLVLDTVRRDYLAAYGNDWVRTPNLTRLAEHGIVFDNHWVGSLPCMPARREFMTGRHNFVYRGWGRSSHTTMCCRANCARRGSSPIC